jgi:23S rRNA (adenine2503-C2)-methyltransferase
MVALAGLLKGRYGLINFIPYNPAEGEGYQRPTAERLAEIETLLRQQGILVKFRQSAGQDIDGGCGQLRARQLARGEGQ